jgi:tight adherence protein B
VAFIVGAAVGYLFYGGIGKDEFGEPTTLTYILNIVISAIVGLIAGYLFVPMRSEQIMKKRQKKLNTQFRDFLEAFNTSLGAGKNVVDSFHSAYKDLKIQYEEDAYILKELEVILSGMVHNVAIEDILYDLGQRSGIDDIVSFANVFKICYRKGGNIKDVIRSTHTILSDKMEAREEIETVVTSAKTEQNIMIVMPILLIGMIKMLSPDFAANFTTVTGVISTTIAIVMFVVAYFVGKIVLDIKM